MIVNSIQSYFQKTACEDELAILEQILWLLFEFLIVITRTSIISVAFIIIYESGFTMVKYYCFEISAIFALYVPN